MIGLYPKTVRLRKRFEYLSLIDSTDKKVGVGFLVVWQYNNLTNARLGVTVSRKVGCAVTRNRIKRYIREVFRNNQITLLAFDINIIARQKSAYMDFNKVKQELEKIFTHIGTSLCSRALHSI